MNMRLLSKRFGAHLHKFINSLFAQVPSENMGKMRLFSLEDLPLLIAVGPSNLGSMISRLRTFQCNLKDYEWPSLAVIYPRPIQWLYAYLLFFWGRYCNVLPSILAHPDRSLPAEVYLRFICQIDTYLDSFDSRSLLDYLVQNIEIQPGIQEVKSDLYSRLDAISENVTKGDCLFGLVNTYLDHNLVVTRHWMASDKMTLEEIKVFKETSTGELYATWSQILSGLYQIPEKLSRHTARIFSSFGMAIQVVDDIADVGQDYLISSPNILLGIASDNPYEYERLISHIRNTEYQYLHLSWVKMNMPQSYAQAIDWICSYVGEIKAITRNNPLTDELINLIATLITFAGFESIKF